MDRKKKVKVLDGRTAASFPMPLARALHRTGILMEIMSEMYVRGLTDGTVAALRPAMDTSIGRRYDGIVLKEENARKGGLWPSVAGLVVPYEAPASLLYLRRGKRHIFPERDTAFDSISFFGDDELHFVLDSLRGITPPFTVNLCGSYRTFRRDDGIYALREEPSGSRLVVRGLEARIAALCERFGEDGVIRFSPALSPDDGILVKEARLERQERARTALSHLDFDISFLTEKEDLAEDVILRADEMPPAMLLDIYYHMSAPLVGPDKGVIWERN